MSDNERPERDVEKLTTRIEKAATKLTGTVRANFVDDRSLCGTCKHATIVRRHSKNNRDIRCAIMDYALVPEDIVECSDYENIKTLSLTQMAEIAVLVDPRGKLETGYL